MVSGEKILVTGVAGQIAFPIARQMAADNEVWGLARFSDSAVRARVEQAGIQTITADLGANDRSTPARDAMYLVVARGRASEQRPRTGWRYDTLDKRTAGGG